VQANKGHASIDNARTKRSATWASVLKRQQSEGVFSSRTVLENNGAAMYVYIAKIAHTELQSLWLNLGRIVHTLLTGRSTDGWRPFMPCDSREISTKMEEDRGAIGGPLAHNEQLSMLRSSTLFRFHNMHAQAPMSGQESKGQPPAYCS